MAAQQSSGTAIAVILYRNFLTILNTIPGMEDIS
jgi:hypothetical protein